MSREERPFIVLAFDSTHDALAAESLLKDLGVPVTPVPAPAEIGAKCGIALRFEPGDAERAKTFLTRAELLWSGEASVRDV